MCHDLYISSLIDGYGGVYIVFNLMHWNIRPKLCRQEKEAFMSDNIRIFCDTFITCFSDRKSTFQSLSLSPPLPLSFAWAIKPIRVKIMITKWKKWYIYIVSVWIEIKVVFFFCTWTVISHGSLFTYCLCTVHVLKILKMGSTILFTHLKIILLQYFQFSVFSFQFQ